MRAAPRGIHSPDLDDLRVWTPPTEDFAASLQLMVGPFGEEGEGSFDLTLCTPGELGRRAAQDGIVDASFHLVEIRYDYDVLTRYLEKRITTLAADPWAELSAQLGRYGRSEFTDYTY